MKAFRQTRLFRRFFLVLLLASGAVSCVQQPSAHLLKELELARTRAGLRPVAENWSVGNSESEVVWAYPNAGGEAKKVAFDKKGPVWEEDYFHSGRTFLAEDNSGESFERLTVHYDYKTGLCAVRVITNDPVLKSKVQGAVEESGVKLEEAIAIARGILKKWGMTY